MIFCTQHTDIVGKKVHMFFDEIRSIPTQKIAETFNKMSKFIPKEECEIITESYDNEEFKGTITKYMFNGVCLDYKVEKG